MEELVVLVDEHNNEIGAMPKSQVHHANTPLHRAFSLFLFNERAELLLQQRSRFKKTWPLVWSNSCCGHPGPGEATEDAIRRRLKDELGLTEVKFELIFPKYRYRFERDGVVENEICPVYVGRADQMPQPNPQEVEAVQFLPWQEFVNMAKIGSKKYSEWSLDEALLLHEAILLDKDKQFQRLWHSWYNNSPWFNSRT